MSRRRADTLHRYVLIDNLMQNMIVADMKAANPIDAVVMHDSEQCLDYDREYELVDRAPSSTRFGYHVYLADDVPADRWFDHAKPGAMLSHCKRVGFVQYTLIK